ncbi:hypothetical protein GCM10022631_38220 [Deinococcus rubellus]|uniref:hypothetical protein n=1 Tax=Deinococcus rubellus TaxID=1889240 RepID=UPI0031EC78C2
MKLRRAALLLTALWLLGPESGAAPISDASAALMNGQVDSAVKLLREKQDASSLVLLARAYVGQSLFVKTLTDKQRLYRASEAAARQAVTADASNAEARTELAYALGLQLQGVGLVEATQKGLEIKRLFDQAVKLDPTAARAWVGLGTWNAQALALGPFVRFASGASEQAMREDYRRAIGLQPNEVFVRLSYADGLLLLAGQDARQAAALKTEAQGILQAALALTPQTYWQRYDQVTVRERLKTLGGNPS